MNCNSATLENDAAGIFNFLTELAHFTLLMCFSMGAEAPPTTQTTSATTRQGNSTPLSPPWRCVKYYNAYATQLACLASADMGVGNCEAALKQLAVVET